MNNNENKFIYQKNKFPNRPKPKLNRADSKLSRLEPQLNWAELKENSWTEAEPLNRRWHEPESKLNWPESKLNRWTEPQSKVILSWTDVNWSWTETKLNRPAASDQLGFSIRSSYVILSRVQSRARTVRFNS